MFSKKPKTSVYLLDLSYGDFKEKHLSQLFPVVTKHCPFKEHMACIFASQGLERQCQIVQSVVCIVLKQNC